MANKKLSDIGYQYYQEITEEGLVDIKEEKPVPTMKTYTYTGPVKCYNDVAIGLFKTRTKAVSEAKAIQNILCQAKLKCGKTPAAGGFRLVNKVHLVDQNQK